MHQVELRLNSEGTETTIVEIGNHATTQRISPSNAKKIQEFVDKYQIEVDVVGSRIDPTKEITPGGSDWDYLLNECEGLVRPKSLRVIEDSAGKYLPKGRSRTDEFGNTRSGLDAERNVPLQPGKPYVKFRPRKQPVE